MLKLQEEFAGKVYLVAEEAYLSAQQELERQQLYLVVVVKPSRARPAGRFIQRKTQMKPNRYESPYQCTESGPM